NTAVLSARLVAKTVVKTCCLMVVPPSGTLINDCYRPRFGLAEGTLVLLNELLSIVLNTALFVHAVTTKEVVGFFVVNRKLLHDKGYSFNDVTACVTALF